MSDYASAIDRAHRAHAAVSQIEGQLAIAPDSKALRNNLLTMQRMAKQAERYIIELSAEKQVEVCKYRLIPSSHPVYDLYYVSKSLLDYQTLCTQIHDFCKNRQRKDKAVFGKEALHESALQFAYSYCGSLGIVLLAPSSRGFFEGNLDRTIDLLFQVVEVDSSESIRSVAGEFGNAVVKRLFDWAQSNFDGNFSTDLQWHRSDGKHLGQVISIERLSRIVNLIDQSSKSETRTVRESGTLVGADILSNSFHFVVPNGADYRGSIAVEFDRSTTMTLSQKYIAIMKETETYYYATERQTVQRELAALLPDG